MLIFFFFFWVVFEGEEANKLSRFLCFCIPVLLNRYHEIIAIWNWNWQITCFCVIIYAHFFLFWYFLLEEKQKSVDIESVCELLGLVLGSQYHAQVDYLIEYLKVSGYIDHVFRNCNWISCWLLVWVHIPTFPYDFSKVVLISFLTASILRCLWVPFLSCPLAYLLHCFTDELCLIFWKKWG